METPINVTVNISSLEIYSFECPSNLKYFLHRRAIIPLVQSVTTSANLPAFPSNNANYGSKIIFFTIPNQNLPAHTFLSNLKVVVSQDDF